MRLHRHLRVQTETRALQNAQDSAVATAHTSFSVADNGRCASGFCRIPSQAACLHSSARPPSTCPCRGRTLWGRSEAPHASATVRKGSCLGLRLAVEDLSAALGGACIHSARQSRARSFQTPTTTGSWFSLRIQRGGSGPETAQAMKILNIRFVHINV